jgi:hypothetical protein
MVALGFLHGASGLGETIDSGPELPRNNVIFFDVSLVAILGNTDRLNCRFGRAVLATERDVAVEAEDTGDTPQKICAFEPCTCPVDKTIDYCGPTCRLGIGERKEPCKCGHAQCKVTIGDG